MANQSVSLEALSKQFEAFQANTPVTIDQVKLVPGNDLIFWKASVWALISRSC